VVETKGGLKWEKRTGHLSGVDKSNYIDSRWEKKGGELRGGGYGDPGGVWNTLCGQGTTGGKFKSEKGGQKRKHRRERTSAKDAKVKKCVAIQQSALWKIEAYDCTDSGVVEGEIERVRGSGPVARRGHTENNKICVRGTSRDQPRSLKDGFWREQTGGV